MTQSEPKEIARRQLADYDARQPGKVFGQPAFAMSLDDAYRVQIETARLRTLRGETVAGYKIGCVSAAVRRQLGTDHAVFGHLFANEIRTSPARLRADEFCCLGVEGELAVRLSSDLGDLAALREDPMRFVRDLIPVIELHHYVLRGQSPSAAEVVANNALQAGIVVPDGEPALSTDGLFEVKVRIGDRIEESATVDPLQTVYELAARLAAFGIRPTAGQILLTGSPLPLYPAGPQDHIRVDCPGVASVTAMVG